MTLQADLKALSDDAATWDAVSSSLTSAASSTWGLSLGLGALSWAAEPTGLEEEYATFVEHVRNLLDQGGTRTGQIAGALRQIKTAYESTDATVRDDFDGLWEPISG